MKRLFAYLVIVLLAAIYAVNSVSSIMLKINPQKYLSSSLFGSDRYRYGDLYGFSYLKKFRLEQDKTPARNVNGQSDRNINLYFMCDSYVWSFLGSDSIFAGVNKVSYAKWNYMKSIDEGLDTTKKNVLVIEISERNIRKLLADTTEMFRSFFVRKDPAAPVNPAAPGIAEKLLGSLFKPFSSQSVDNNLLDYRIFTPVRELKAAFNYYVFDRTDVDVVVSSDKDYLFYSITTDPVLNTSSFCPLGNNEVRKIAANINMIYDRYKKYGFDNVYFSIVPNPVTVLEPEHGDYNDLLPKLQSGGILKTPIIDLYSVFCAQKDKVYSRSDSHWNAYGFQLWVDEVNKVLSKEMKDYRSNIRY